MQSETQRVTYRVKDRPNNTGVGYDEYQHSRSLSPYVPLSKGIAIGSTDLPYGHFPIRGSIRGVYLVPLRTHPTRGWEALGRIPVRRD